MKHIAFVFLSFTVIIALITIFFVTYTKRVTNDLAFASGSKKTLLVDFIDTCDVLLLDSCGFVQSKGSTQLRISSVQAIIDRFPQGALAASKESAEAIVRASEETGVHHKILLALSSSIGTDPLRKASGDREHPFGQYVPEDGLYEQTKSVALTLWQLQKETAPILSMGDRKYEIVQSAANGSRVIYRYLAGTLQSPARFERLILPTNQRYSDNLFTVWEAIYGVPLR